VLVRRPRLPRAVRLRARLAPSPGRGAGRAARRPHCARRRRRCRRAHGRHGGCRGQHRRRLCPGLWGDAERFLTLAIANYVTLVNPETLILGGGVFDDVPELFDDLTGGVLAATTILARESLRIEHARLGSGRASSCRRTQRAVPPSSCSNRVYSTLAMAHRPDRLDYCLAVGLSVLTILSRLPYRARMLYNWDAVQFALALHEYDVVKHQPHPPATSSTWRSAARARLHRLTPPAPTSCWPSLFSGAGTFVVYLLAARSTTGRPRWLAATLLAVSPLFWFYGTVGLTYAGEALFASIVAYFAFRASAAARATRGWPPAISASPGACASRCCCSSSRCGSSSRWSGSGARAPCSSAPHPRAAVLAWFVPMIWLTGGLGATSRPRASSPTRS
jgi:predicted NBD/HSP70 family sugar kinase